MNRVLPLLFAVIAFPALSEGQIVTETEFREKVVGRELRLAPEVTFVINADNTISGEIEGRPATGTWRFEDGFWCRRIDFEDIYTEDCQLWVVDGDELVITRERGEGESFRYKRAQ